MNRLKLTALTLFIACATSVVGQKQANVWYFGEGVGLDFNTNPLTVLTDGKIDGPTLGNPFSSEGASSICDSAGNLLFYTNGELIWDVNHQVMPNGSGLLGHYSSTQSSLIVPQPASDSLFYVFTTDGFQNNLVNGLRYSVVDMCLNDGYGDVVTSTKNTLLHAPTAEKLHAVKHANGQDYWIMTHDWGSDGFYAYLLTSLGIQTPPVISNIGAVHSGPVAEGLGQMKFSHDGSMLAIIKGNSNPNLLELFDFDPATGVVSNLRSLIAPIIPFALEFSPDNTRLYTNSLGLFQFDLTAGNAAAINASRTQITLPQNCSPAGIQLAPNGKIYLNQCSTSLISIDNPNALAANLSVNTSAVTYPAGTQVQFSLPSYVAGFDYDNTTVSCAPVCNAVADFTFLGDTVICAAETITFVSLSSGSSNLSWQENGVEVGTDSILELQFSKTGLVFLDLIVGDSLCNDTLTQAFQVTEAPSNADAGPDQMTCTTTTQLDAVAPLVGTGAWMSITPTGSFDDVQDPTTLVTGLTNGVNTAVFQTINGVCVPSYDTVLITVVNAIIPTIAWSPGTLMASTGSSYQWFLDGTPLSDSTDQIIHPNINGTYTVSVVDANGCEGTSEGFTIANLSIENLSVGTLEILPNPADSRIEIRTGELQKAFDVEVYDAYGKRVAVIQQNAAGQRLALDVSNYASGIYFVKAFNAQAFFQGRFVVR